MAVSPFIHFLSFKLANQMLICYFCPSPYTSLLTTVAYVEHISLQIAKAVLDTQTWNAKEAAVLRGRKEIDLE